MSVLPKEILEKKSLYEKIELAIGELSNYSGEKLKFGNMELMGIINKHWKEINDGQYFEHLIFKAIGRGNSEILNHLLYKNKSVDPAAFIDLCNRNRITASTPIEAAIYYNSPECLNVLLPTTESISRPLASKDEIENITKIYSDLSIPSAKAIERLKKSPLELVLEFSTPHCLMIMINDSNINNFITENTTQTPLIYALAKGNFTNALWLLEQPGINLTLKNLDNNEDAFTYFARAQGAMFRKAEEEGPALPPEDPYEDSDIATERLKRKVYQKLKEKVLAQDRKEFEEVAHALQGKVELNLYNQASRGKPEPHEKKKQFPPSKKP